MYKLRTGHNRLNYHLHSKLCIGHIQLCPCGTGSQTTELLLQPCSLYELLGTGIWPDHTPHTLKALQQPGGLKYHHLHPGDCHFHLTKKKRKKKTFHSNANTDVYKQKNKHGQCSLECLHSNWFTRNKTNLAPKAVAGSNYTYSIPLVEHQCKSSWSSGICSTAKQTYRGFPIRMVYLKHDT